MSARIRVIKRMKYINMLRDKRREVSLMGDHISSRRKLLNIEIDMLLEILDLKDDELLDLADIEVSDET